jgi:hypothetical protein
MPLDDNPFSLQNIKRNTWRDDPVVAPDPVGENPFAASNKPWASDPIVDANPFSLDTIQKQQQQRSRFMLEKAAVSDPNKAAEAHRLAKATGAPLPVVERNLDEVRRKHQAQEVNLELMQRVAPALAAQLSDPTFVGMAHDDLGPLTALGQFFTDTYGSVKAGVFNASRGAAGVFQAGAELVAPVLDPLEGVTSIGGNPLRRLAEGFAMQGGAAGKSAKAAAPKTEGNISGGFQAGVQSLVQNMLTLPMAFAGPGGTGAALASMVGMTGGQSYQDAREKGLGMPQALPYAASQAAIEFATEKMPLTRLIGDLKAGTPFVKTLMRQVALEVPGEQVATILQDLNEWAILNPEKPFSAYLAERPNAAAQTLIATIVGTGGNVTVMKGIETLLNRVAGEGAGLRDADAHAQALGQALRLAESSALRTREPEVFTGLMESMSNDGSIHIDAQVLNQLPAEMLQRMEGVLEQMPDALATDGTVSVKLADVLAQVPGTAAAVDVFVQHARSAPDAPTLAESKLAGDQAQQWIEQEATRVIAEAQDQDAVQQSSDRVKQTIMDQLTATRRFRQDVNETKATLTAAMYTTLAGRYGITPEEAMARHPLQIVGKTGDGASLEQPTSDINHKREKGTGRYVGAPDWVGASPQQLTVLRKNLRQLAAEGERGRFWYENSSKAILAVTGGDRDQAERFAGLIAIYSPNNTVPGNTSMALKAYHQWTIGEPVRAGTSDNDAKAQQWMDTGKDWGGIKTNSFYQGLMTEIDPSKLDPTRSTMDMWMALAGDYGSKALDQGPKYTFMQRETARLAKEMGWTPHQTQAAIWSAIKGRVEASEGPRKAYEIKKGIAALVTETDPETGKSKTSHQIVKGREYDHFRTATKFGMSHVLTHEDITRAKYDFSDALNERMVQLSWEAKPGESTGVLPGIFGAPMSQQVEYFEAIKRALTDAQGRDIIAARLGIATESSTGAAGWKGITGIGAQDKMAAAVPGGVIDKSSERLISLWANIRGLVLAQEGMAWHFPYYKGTKSEQNGMHVDLGRPVTIEEADALYQAISRELGHDQAPPIHHESGVRFLNFPDAKFALMDKGLTGDARKALLKESAAANKKFHDAVVAAIKSVQSVDTDVKDVAKFQSEGNLYENDWSKGDADYRARILEAAATLERTDPDGGTGRSDLLGWVDSDLHPKIQAVNADFAARYGWDKARQARVGQDGQLLAPNGKPSKLNAAQHAAVRTPEFKAWFGDWEKYATVEGGVFVDTNGEVSKAVDPETGEPLVLYHGTDTGGFDTFRKVGGAGRGDLGIFATPSRAQAESYLFTGTEQKLEFGGQEPISTIYALFLNVRNPVVDNFAGASWDGQRADQEPMFEVQDANGMPVGSTPMSRTDADALAASTGGTVHPALGQGRTTDDVVMEARQYGYDGAIVRQVVDNGIAGYTVEPQDLYVALEPNQVKSADLNTGAFDGNDPNILNQPARGTFNPKTLELALTENADLSTFFHELGHFYLEVLADLASQPNAPADVQQDMAALLKWFGVDDLDTWQGYTLDEKRDFHEQFAKTFEQYLMTGKAPSLALQPLFRKVRAWLLNVYRSLQAFVAQHPDTDIKIPADVRQVMDKALASEEQIAQAEKVAGLLPDMDATQEAIEKLTARSIRDLKWAVNARSKAIKALQKQAAGLRKEVEAEVRAEVDAMPEFLAKAELRKMHSENKRALNDTELAIMADAFGYPDADNMLRAIDAAGNRSDVIQGMTDQRMLERHGDLIDQRAIEDAATEAVHNEARAKSLATELKAQTDAMNPRQDTGRTNVRGSRITVNAIVEAGKLFAANVVARTPLKDLKIKTRQHLAAEARAGKRWQAATTAGKTEDAIKAKQDQVLNHAAAKATMEAQTEVKEILEFFKTAVKGANKTTVEKGRDPDVVNAARAILGAYGVAPKAAKSALEYLDLVEKNDPAMFAVIQPSVLGAMQNAQPLEALSMEQLRGLHEEIQAMWHLAKRSRQMEVDGDMMDIDDAADELSNRLQTVGVPLEVPGQSGAVTPGEMRTRWLQHAGSLLRRVEQWAEGMDGKFGGPFLRLVFQPVKDAADAYRADRVVYRKAYLELLDKIAPTMNKGTIVASELGYTFGQGHNGIGHAELLHAILHTGNDSNKRKLLLGRKWATENQDGTLDTSKWDQFITRMTDTGVLTKAHYDFAQGVWDLLEKTKPLAQKTHRDVFGRYFEEVTANSFDTPFGVYRGGYVPAQADPRIVQDASLRALATLENENMAYSFPATNKGFTKNRVDYNRPLMLDLRTIGQHIDKVLLFSHMEPAVRDVNKLLSRKAVSQQLGKVDPTIYEGMLTPWLNRSARQIVETPVVGDGGISRVLAAARSRAGMALMFANISNTLQQVTGFTTAFSKMKADGLQSSMMRATAQFIASPKKMAATVADASPFMANRMANEISAINESMDEILLNPSLYASAQAWSRKHAYFMQTALDNVMGPVIWTAGYNGALAKGMSTSDAVRYADGLIRQTQGSTLPEDVSRIETGPAYARVFTQFIGYFNMMANTNATALKQVASEMGLRKGAGKALGVVFFGMLLPLWIAEAIAIAMRGGPEDEDDDGYLDDWLAAVLGMGTIKGTLAMVPFVGQLANAAINRFNSNPADDKVSLSPAVSILESAVGVPTDVYKMIEGKGNARTLVRDVASAVSIATGLPATALARPLGYLAGIADDRIEPTSELDAVRGVLTGTPSPESKQR